MVKQNIADLLTKPHDVQVENLSSLGLIVLRFQRRIGVFIQQDYPPPHFWYALGGIFPCPINSLACTLTKDGMPPENQKSVFFLPKAL